LAQLMAELAHKSLAGISAGDQENFDKVAAFYH
jgi:hypothetical protein